LYLLADDQNSWLKYLGTVKNNRNICAKVGVETSEYNRVARNMCNVKIVNFVRLTLKGLLLAMIINKTF
jgi:hypothetical protein